MERIIEEIGMALLFLFFGGGLLHTAICVLEIFTGA